MAISSVLPIYKEVDQLGLALEVSALCRSGRYNWVGTGLGACERCRSGRRNWVDTELVFWLYKFSMCNWGGMYDYRIQYRLDCCTHY